MMNSQDELPAHGNGTAAPADAEARLEMNREILRQRLAQEEERNDAFGPLGDAARMAAWLARQLVREHPYTSLAGAALAGAWLIRGKPWRALGGSVLAGVLARQALALSLSSGGQLLGRLSAAARARQASHPPF
jgi:ElaB/YqjD/DUF883 family membrane-anchored ribosome-binding protein